MKFTLTTIFLSLCVFAWAQDTSTFNFNKDLSWKQVLEKAKNENKIVFVDLYTDWCVPCKRMEKEVFSLKTVSDTFNKKFVNYRINAEKGEGIGVAKRYGVGGYPYFVFVDGDGTLYYSMLGYREERQLLEDAAIAFQEVNDPKPYGIWKEEYDAKKYDVAWLKGYIQKRNKLRMDNAQLIEDYYAQLKPADYMKSENVELVTKSSGIKLNGSAFRILTKHFTSISPREDSLYKLEENLLAIFENALNEVFVKAIEEKNEAPLFKEVIPAYAAFPEKIRSMPWYSKQDQNKWKFIFYRHTNNVKKFIPIAILYIKKHYQNLNVNQIRKNDSLIYQRVLANYKAKKLDSLQMQNMMPMLDHYYKNFITNDHLERLMDASNFVFSNSSGPTDLSTALTWSKRAMQIQKNSSTLELTSKILYKMNRKPEAIALMQSAIAKADNPSDKNRLTLVMNNMKQNKRI